MKIFSKKYKKGDIKTVRRFAWFPIRIGDELIWFEYFYTDYKYVDEVHFTHGGGYVEKWRLLKSYQ